MNKNKTMLVALFATALLIPLTVQADQEAEAKAIESAEIWLGLADSGEYDRCWDTAASLFKRVVTKQQWKHAVTTVRQPLGAVRSREFLSKQYVTTLPGVPDGKYVVIQFRTTFANKNSAVETITPMLDEDDQWRVSGYFVK